MQDAENHDVVTLENQITERYGLLISQTQLAELLGRTTGGLRCHFRKSEFIKNIPCNVYIDIIRYSVYISNMRLIV